MTAHGDRPNYLAVWIWLVALAIGSIVLSRTPLGHTAVLVLVFLLAAAKALLVALNYMHLRYERVLIYAIVLVPVVFVVGLLLALIPDMVFGR
ncbi:MAG: cytochrome C oxidase subunit IV family protein [Candidatus Methylomirabilia bacterium]